MTVCDRGFPIILIWEPISETLGRVLAVGMTCETKHLKRPTVPKFKLTAPLPAQSADTGTVLAYLPEPNY